MDQDNKNDVNQDELSIPDQICFKTIQKIITEAIFNKKIISELNDLIKNDEIGSATKILDVLSYVENEK